jgi:hypothetical protein
MLASIRQINAAQVIILGAVLIMLSAVLMTVLLTQYAPQT